MGFLIYLYVKKHFMLSLFLLFGRNGQRPGAITNMEVEEVGRGKVEGGVLTIKVRKHKTGMSERAGIGVTGGHLEEWMVVRQAIFPHSTLAFPSWSGNAIDNLTSKVCQLATQFGIFLPTTREARSNLEIRAASTLDTGKQSLVARHLSHSKASAEKSYRALEVSKRAEAFGVVGELMQVQGQQTSRKRKKFSTREEELIRDHFQLHISERHPPKKEESLLCSLSSTIGPARTVMTRLETCLGTNN